MTELINLRAARKRAKRQQDETRAEANRLAHGRPKHLCNRTAAERAKAERDLERHWIDKGDSR
jgi:F0F1-type ATP synthase membrane subunit b/b'